MISIARFEMITMTKGKRIVFFLLLCVLLVLLSAPVCSDAEREKDGGYGDYYVRLNSGHKMPMLGLGTWTLDDAAAEQSVYEALKDGYRLIFHQ